MASTVRENWTCYRDGTVNSYPIVGRESKLNRVMRYQFETGTSGASHIYFKLGNVAFIKDTYASPHPINWYISTDATSHVNAGVGSANFGSISFNSGYTKGEVDRDIQLNPNTTYYFWIFPSVEDYGYYEFSRSPDDNDLVLSGAAYTKCTAPTSFTASPDVWETDITLSWEGASGGTNNSITGYELEYATSGDKVIWSTWNLCGTPIQTSSPVVETPGAFPRGNYIKYRIRTLGSAGASYYSDWIESNAVRKLQASAYIKGNPYLAYIKSGDNMSVYMPCIYKDGVWVING